MLSKLATQSFNILRLIARNPNFLRPKVPYFNVSRLSRLKMTQNGPKWPKYDPKWPKMALEWAKMIQSGPKIKRSSNLKNMGAILAPCGSNTVWYIPKVFDTRRKYVVHTKYKSWCNMARDLPGTKLGFIVWQSFSGLLRKENGCSVFCPKAIYRSLVSYIGDWDHIIYDARSLVSYIGDWKHSFRVLKMPSCALGLECRRQKV